MATDYIESAGVKDIVGVKLIGANSQIVDSATLAEQQAQTALLDLIKQNTTGLVKNDKEIPFVWFLVKQAFTDVTTDDIVVCYSIINTETGVGTPYTKRWRGWVDVTVPSPITDYLVPTGGMPLTLAQFQSIFGNTSDSVATTDSGTFSFIALFKRSLQHLSSLVTLLSPVSVSSSSALESERQAKASAGTIYGVDGQNTLTSDQYLMIFDSASTPADGSVPKFVFKIFSEQPFSIDFGAQGISFANGIFVCNSTTAPTKTIGAANCFFSVRYK